MASLLRLHSFLCDWKERSVIRHATSGLTTRGYTGLHLRSSVAGNAETPSACSCLVQVTWRPKPEDHTVEEGAK